MCIRYLPFSFRRRWRRRVFLRRGKCDKVLRVFRFYDYNIHTHTYTNTARSNSGKGLCKGWKEAGDDDDYVRIAAGGRFVVLVLVRQRYTAASASEDFPVAPVSCLYIYNMRAPVFKYH